MKYLVKVIFVALIGLTLVSCEKEDELPLNSNSKIFNIDLFEQNIIETVTGNDPDPVAWAYAINKDGTLVKSGAFGDARRDADGQVDFTLDKEINVASVTKFYTGIVAMKLLDQNGLTIDDKVEEWLPDSWEKGIGMSNLTFKDLLTHTSGLRSINSKFDSTLSYAGLKECIANGVTEAKEPRAYLNVNFALFRVLIPSLYSALPENSFTYDIESDTDTRLAYLLIMHKKLFSKAQLREVSVLPEARDVMTLYYNADDDASVTGSPYGDWTGICGGGGYYMTPREMAAVNAYFEHTEDILSNELKQVLKENRIGLDVASNTSEKYGKYYGKGGDISNGAGQGVKAQITMFPNGIEIVVIMNSQGTTFKDGADKKMMISNAYDDAWEEQ